MVVLSQRIYFLSVPPKIVGPYFPIENRTPLNHINYIFSRDKTSPKLIINLLKVENISLMPFLQVIVKIIQIS